MRGRAVIAGVGHTAYGKHEGRDRISLIVEASRNAIADAGIAKDMVDGVLVKMANAEPSILYGQKVAEALGMRPKVGCSLDQGGAANIALISYAAMAIEAGLMEVAIICYGDTPRTGSRKVYGRARGDDAVYGWYSTAAGYALLHQRYRQQHAIPDEHFGAVAVTCRDHGARNPNAHLQKAISLDEYMASPFVVEPLRRDDCCLLSDGAAAVIVMSAKRAAELRIAGAVPILGFGQAQESWDVHLRENMTRTISSLSGETALRMAGLDRRDIAVAQLYDCFTVTPLITLEDYGFCRPGEAARFAADGGIALDGRLPLNTSGGLLSESGTPGLQLVIEGVRQMRGDANLQIRGGGACIVSNQGGTMHTHATLILGRAA
ncbi:MAG: thiolase family protein [Phreatobacter sp.]|uniref:thiolase family protein n=1 Tax=Phreatobacter sp. TaxID=1966341 RepID=UPI001A4A3850|nr:thiolase family protein [Phreatobacter sp.]MBL8570715.1 thiolase family protein [Phreatobacter sp.]